MALRVVTRTSTAHVTVCAGVGERRIAIARECLESSSERAMSVPQQIVVDFPDYPYRYTATRSLLWYSMLKVQTTLVTRRQHLAKQPDTDA